MTTSASDSTTMLSLRRILPVPREEVFSAWTQPDQLSEWFAPSDDYEKSKVEIDLRVGGSFRVHMKHKTKETVHTVSGTYRDIRFPSKLVFTWSWKEPRDDDSVVTIELREVKGGTELILRHERLADDSVRADHEKGWIGCLDRLERQMHP